MQIEKKNERISMNRIKRLSCKNKKILKVRINNF